MHSQKNSHYSGEDSKWYCPWYSVHSGGPNGWGKSKRNSSDCIRWGQKRGIHKFKNCVTAIQWFKPYLHVQKDCVLLKRCFCANFELITLNLKDFAIISRFVPFNLLPL